MILGLGFWNSDSKVLGIFKSKANRLAQNEYIEKAMCVKMTTYTGNFIHVDSGSVSSDCGQVCVNLTNTEKQPKPSHGR